MKYLLALLLFCTCVSPIYGQKNRVFLVFEEGESNLNTALKSQINTIFLPSKTSKRITIYPLTKDTLFDNYKFSKQSEEQAKAISDYAKTIGCTLIGTPTNFPSTYKGRSIGVVLSYKVKAISTLEAENFSMQAHYPEKPSQFFTINPLRDTLIIGKEGTELFFAAGALTAKKMVEVELKEFYQLSDYMKAGLPSVSNNEMIETGGSIYLNAKEQESQRQVNINQQIGIDAEFKLGKGKDNMQVFVKDESSSKMNWVPQDNNKKSKWTLTVTDTVEGLDDLDMYYMVSTTTIEFDSKEEMLAYINTRQQKKKDEKKLRNGLKLLKFGYINCDAFIKQEMITYAVASDQEVKAEYFLIYQSVRGVMKGQETKGKVTFGSVPKNVDAILIAISFIAGKAYFYKTSLSPRNGKDPGITLTPVSEAYINKQLLLLN